MTATTKRIESTRVETSEGVVFFTIWEEYRDGKLWKRSIVQRIVEKDTLGQRW